jgi:hypothetical protein
MKTYICFAEIKMNYQLELNMLNNMRVLEELKEGDRVEFRRGPYYSHWGVYVGQYLLILCSLVHLNYIYIIYIYIIYRWPWISIIIISLHMVLPSMH